MPSENEQILKMKKKVKFLIEKENIIVNIDYSYNSYKCIFSLNELNNSFRDSFDVRRVNWGDSPTSVKAKEKVLSFKNEPIKEDPNHIFYFTRIFGHNCSIIYNFIINISFFFKTFIFILSV